MSRSNKLYALYVIFDTRVYITRSFCYVQILLETLTECRAVDKAVLLCVHLNKFPVNDDYQEGVIDVWWIVHDGGLLLLLAHLLQQHKIWRKCKVRVHTVAEKLDNSDIVKRNLEKLLETVSVVNKPCFPS